MPPSPAMCLGDGINKAIDRAIDAVEGALRQIALIRLATVSTEPFNRALLKSLSKECFNSVLRGSALTERFEGVRRERYLREIRHLLQKGLRQDVVI